MVWQQCGELSYLMFVHGVLLTLQPRLVATVGVKSNTRKLSKKAIQDVNVAKACETIGEPPGAPIALRLQGNLLYGVSRVYSQQYTYLLTDAEKVQLHMRTFYRAWQTNEIDPEAGKTK